MKWKLRLNVDRQKLDICSSETNNGTDFLYRQGKNKSLEKGEMNLVMRTECKGAEILQENIQEKWMSGKGEEKI